MLHRLQQSGPYCCACAHTHTLTDAHEGCSLKEFPRQRHRGNLILLFFGQHQDALLCLYVNTKRQAVNSLPRVDTAQGFFFCNHWCNVRFCRYIRWHPFQKITISIINWCWGVLFFLRQVSHSVTPALLYVQLTPQNKWLTFNLN